MRTNSNKKLVAKTTVTRVYLTHKPITINSPSIPESLNVSFDGDKNQFTEEKFLEVLKRVSLPEQYQPDEEKH